MTSGMLIPCYHGFWVQNQSGPLEQHKHQFCPINLNRCVGGYKRKFAIAKL
jgi:hypothetical protein